MNDNEIADASFGDLAFEERVLASVVNVSPHYKGTLEVESFPDATSRLTWSETTEEGRRLTEATFCHDEHCDSNLRSYRDYTAEAMGY